jgi:hypothetical protein
MTSKHLFYWTTVPRRAENGKVGVSRVLAINYWKLKGFNFKHMHIQTPVLLDYRSKAFRFSKNPVFDWLGLGWGKDGTGSLS